MKVFAMILKLTGAVVNITMILVICTSLIFVLYKGNQPMTVPQAPKGMTYFEFMGDRLDAARTVKPSQCGWGMMLSLATLGPVYSVIYTVKGIDPNGFISRVTASDPDVPKGVAGASWIEIPDIWWGTVERLSWTMLGKPAKYGCKFRAVSDNNK